jgi:hypothetical protein
MPLLLLGVPLALSVGALSWSSVTRDVDRLAYNPVVLIGVGLGAYYLARKAKLI